MSAFDAIQRTVFGAVAEIFGENARWYPSAVNGGGLYYPAKVLFSAPTDEGGFARDGSHMQGAPTFDQTRPVVEYFAGSFNGLFEAVAQKKKEFLFIEMGGQLIRYQVLKVTAKWDGKSYFAHLALMPLPQTGD